MLIWDTSMCDFYSSFGINHDGADNTCSSSGFIMASDGGYNSVDLTWSQCSRNQFLNFYRYRLMIRYQFMNTECFFLFKIPLARMHVVYYMQYDTCLFWSSILNTLVQARQSVWMMYQCWEDHCRSGNPDCITVWMISVASLSVARLLPAPSLATTWWEKI